MGEVPLQRSADRQSCHIDENNPCEKEVKSAGEACLVSEKRILNAQPTQLSWSSNARSGDPIYGRRAFSAGNVSASGLVILMRPTRVRKRYKVQGRRGGNLNERTV